MTTSSEPEAEPETEPEVELLINLVFSKKSALLLDGQGEFTVILTRQKTLELAYKIYAALKVGTDEE